MADAGTRVLKAGAAASGAAAYPGNALRRSVPLKRQVQPMILVLGPSREAMSGVSTHLNLLFASTLSRRFQLKHFQVGSEGRKEGRLARCLRLIFSPLALLAAVLQSGAEVVHINTSLNPRAFWRDLAYLLMTKLAGAKVVYQVHGGDLPQDFFKGRLLLTWLLRGVLSLPDLIVVLASIELQAYRDFVPEQHIAMLPNGIDCKPFEGIRAQPGRGECLRLSYIGRLAPGKGLDEILQALQQARRQGAQVSLVLAGGGVEEARLRDLLPAMDLEQAVSFAGPVFGEAKLKLLEQTDVFLLPSYAEGLPYAMMESMAAGVPVVVTPVGAIPDVVAHGVHGLLVPVRNAAALAEAILKLDADRTLLTHMGEACRRRIAACYSLERLAADFTAAYAKLCPGPVGAKPGIFDLENG